MNQPLIYENESVEKLKENKKRMIKRVDSFGSSFKSAKLESDGVSVSHDLSHLSFKQSIKDGKFWHIWFMVLLSMVYGFFTKVSFKSYGSIIYDDD